MIGKTRQYFSNDWETVGEKSQRLEESEIFLPMIGKPVKLGAFHYPLRRTDCGF
jgi:hypothetical protein